MITINESTTVQIDYQGSTLDVELILADPIDGMRIERAVQTFGPVIVESLDALSKSEPYDLDALQGAFTSMYTLLLRWIYTIHGVEMRGLGGKIVSWAGMLDEQKVKIFSQSPTAFMGLFAHVLGREEDEDLGKSQLAPTLEESQPARAVIS